MYYGFIVYSLRDQPAVLRHCIISDEHEEDSVMRRQQHCADSVNASLRARRDGHCKRAGGCDHPFVASDIRIRTVTTIPTSLLDTVRTMMHVIPCDKMGAAIAVLSALAAQES
jgi:hypothetical protein